MLLLAIGVAYQCTSQRPQLTREVAKQLIAESILRLRGTSPGVAGIDSGLWIYDRDSCPVLRFGEVSTDPRAASVTVLDITGLTGEGLERTATFVVGLGGLPPWGSGQGSAEYQLYDDGWRLIRAHIAECSQLR
jgi:hypothetical protein